MKYYYKKKINKFMSLEHNIYYLQNIHDLVKSHVFIDSSVYGLLSIGYCK